MTEYERVIKIHEKSLIPPGIIESDLSMQSYLEQNVIKNRKHEEYRLRSAKAVRTRKNNLEAAARKISVTPTTDAESAVSDTAKQQTKKWTCKTEKTPQKLVVWNKRVTTAAEEEEPREGTLVTEEIKGIIVVCDFCGHRWTHHSKNLGRQYYTQCGICRRNVRLKHYQ
jgi:hypothetical protein